MRFNFSLGNIEVGAILSARRKRTNPIGGVTNRTHDGMYVPFLDYDAMPRDWIIPELESIQKDFGLGTFYVFSSGPGHYHAVCLSKVTREEYESILHRSSCDPQYKKVPWTWGRRVNTLRVTEKAGRVVSLLTSVNPASDSNRTASLAHTRFFQGLYDIQTHELRYDRYTDLIMAGYVV